MGHLRPVEASITAAYDGGAPVRVETVGPGVDRRAVMLTAALVLVSFAAAAVTLALVQPDRAAGEQPIDRILVYVQLGSIVVPTIIAFFGFYLARTEMRDAIAGAFLLSFNLILSESLILSLGLFGTEPGSVREIFITNYMNLTGTIALFYFGSEAVIRIANQLAAGRVGTATAQQVGQTTPASPPASAASPPPDTARESSNPLPD